MTRAYALTEHQYDVVVVLSLLSTVLIVGALL